jgi:hypothetical protein
VVSKEVGPVSEGVLAGSEALNVDMEGLVKDVEKAEVGSPGLLRR